MTDRAAPQDLVPRAVRQIVIDTVGGDGLYVVRQITEMFELEDFVRAPLAEPQTTGQRRQEAEAFQAGIDFTSVEQSQRYLRVVAQILSDHAGEEDWKRMKRDRLLSVLRRNGIEPDEKGNLQLPPSRALGSLRLAGIPTESDIRLHIRQERRRSLVARRLAAQSQPESLAATRSARRWPRQTGSPESSIRLSRGVGPLAMPRTEVLLGEDRLAM